MQTPHEIEQNPNRLKSKARTLIINTILSDSLNFLMTFISKLINVIFTVLIARSVTKSSYGLATIYFSFIYIIITMFPSEVLRKTTSQYSHDKNEENENRKFQDSAQVAWISNIIIFILSFFLYYAFTYLHPDLLQYRFHIVMYVLSGWIEIASEPIMIYMNVKIINKHKFILMFFSDYMYLFLNYFFACYCGLDLWSFTLSRVCTSVMYCVYLFYLAKNYFKLDQQILMPSVKKMKGIIKNIVSKTNTERKELSDMVVSDTKSWSVSTMITFTERIVLSFFTRYTDDVKAEYSFVKENFSFFKKYSISPSEENFFILFNKIKNYKNLTTLKLSKDINMNDYSSADFSLNENQYIIKSLSMKNASNYKKESYSYKLLKTSIRLYFIISIVIMSVLSLLGKEVIVILFTDKWVNEHTYQLIKLFLISFSLQAIASKFTSYSSAIFIPSISEMSNGFNYANIFLYLALSFSLSQIGIAGLVYASIIYNTGKIIINWYFAVKNEFINEEGSNVIYHEMIAFAKEAFIKSLSLISTLICCVICYLLNSISTFDKFQDIKPITILAADIIIVFNVIAVIFLEKDDFMDILRLKINN